MPNLTIFLFGRPQIFIDGAEVTGFNTRKDQALLAYLAMTGSSHSRETLAGLLWSELPEEKARRNLRHALSHLQKVIGPDWLTTTRGVALTPDHPWSVDVQTLRAVLAPGQHSLDNDSALIEQVLSLYRGEFLQGFHIQEAVYFEEWVLAQREELRQLTLRELETLAERCVAQAAYAPGLSATHHLLQLEPRLESVHRLHMQLLVQSGHRAEALAQYERCRQLLATELGVDPMPETTALYQQIQTGLYNGLEPSTVNKVVDNIPPVSTNLLAPLAEFVGRETELAFISRRLGAADCRLLTIVGPGGMGKSSLALAVGQRLLGAAEAHFDGIFWVPLAEVSTTEPAHDGSAGAEDAHTGEAILRAIANQLGGEQAGRISSTGELQTYLRSRRLLLIVDNFEHLTAGTGAVVALLGQAPQVKMLITSRARLNVRGETVLTLNHLALPTAAYQAAVSAAQTNPGEAIPPAVWQASEAVVMFVQRAQQFDADFTINATTIGSVGQICQLVEGLPLGIELATGMLPLLSCAALAQDLAKGLDFLEVDTRDLPYEQRTLGAVFERSWRLLTPEEQLLLAKLSIFPGSFRHEAAAEIVGAHLSQLQHLLNQSLLSKAGEGRYTLHRTVHAFAQQKLQPWPAQIALLHVQYARFYLEFLARQDLTGAKYGLAIEQIQADRDNMQMAWRRAVTYGLATELTRSLNTWFMYYEQQGFYLEAIELYTEALEHFATALAPPTHQQETTTILLSGRLQTCLGLWNVRVGRFAHAHAAYEASWAILQRVDNPAAAAACLGLWGTLLKVSNLQRAEDLLKMTIHLSQATDDRWLKSLAAQALGEISLFFGNYATAVAQLRTGCALAEEMTWARGLASANKSLGRVHLALGDYHQAEAYLRAGLQFARQHRLNILCLEGVIALGEVRRFQGDVDAARVCFVESRQLVEKLGAGLFLAPVLWEEGCLAAQCGEYATAKRLLTESLAIGLPLWWSHVLPTLGWVLLALNEVEEAEQYFQKVWTAAEPQARLPISLDAQVGLAYVQIIRLRADSPDRQAVLAQGSRVLQTVYHHPAATAETRQRIDKIAFVFA